MQNLTLENLAADDNKIQSSRRKFLTNIACGSLLFLAGTTVASASERAKHLATRKAVANKSRRATTHHVAKNSHHSLKHSISHRLAKKSSHTHKKLAAHHSHHKHYSHSKHNRIHLASHKSSSTRSQLYRADALVLDTHEDRRLFAQKIPSKMISLQNPYTGDHVRLTYFERGLYINDALQEIDYIFRDHHSGDVHPVDPALLDQLFELKLRLGVSRPFNIISGYRSPETNSNLRRHSHGVAKHSLHMEGRAIDIRLDGCSTKTLRNAALSMKRGGVGYYSKSNFIHLDTGDVRTWGA